MKIQYKELKREELKLLREVDRSEKVEEVYYIEDGQLKLREEEYIIDDWVEDELNLYINRIEAIHDCGGVIYGAFIKGEIVGMAALDNKLFGDNKDRLKLDIMYISNNYRRRGIGKSFINMISKKAYELGGRYLYISATPFRNTVDFYLSMGARTTTNIDKDLFKLEPEDIHMEMKLKPSGKLLRKLDRKKLVNTIYEEIFDEDKRLEGQAEQIEFLTAIRNIDKYIEKDMKILDLGAGTGRYSLYYASKGYNVTAVEMVRQHVEKINEKKTDDMELEVYEGDALDLSFIEDKSFDMVLCFGPMYHLYDEKDRLKCLGELKRITKDGGIIFFAFISNDMVIVTETMLYNKEFLLGDGYEYDSFKVKEKPFSFTTVDEARRLLKKSEFEILEEIAVDGLSELLRENINEMDEDLYKKWLEFHYYISEKPEFLGVSNHLLFITKR